MKRTFLESFANDPAQFIQTWLESQSRDLESILGSGPTEGMTLRQEELKRSEFFQLPWVEEVRYNLTCGWRGRFSCVFCTGCRDPRGCSSRFEGNGVTRLSPFRFLFPFCLEFFFVFNLRCNLLCCNFMVAVSFIPSQHPSVLLSVSRESHVRLYLSFVRATVEATKVLPIAIWIHSGKL